MRRGVTLAGLAVALVLFVLWMTGGLAGLSAWVAEGQRAAQDRLAGAVRALRGGEPGAVAALLAVCLGYGVLHAAGPGHGKALIGGYGLARRVPVLRLSALALAGSLAQAAVAVALVYAGVAVLGLARGQVTGAAETWVPLAGNMMIAVLGGWLLWRGWRGLGEPGPAGGLGHDHHGHRENGHDHHDHDQDHDHGHVHGAGCGHAHGPTIEQAAAVTTLRDAALLVGGIALRPCSGALFLLILTWQLGIGAMGIAGAFAMGIGVAGVTIAVAALAVWAREGALAALPGQGLARALPLVEAVAGAVILTVALGLVWQAI